ncbi:UvrD-helicase domain-containing protein [Sphingomonas sp. SM33]|uniref:DNA 3'-5' helicase n=1 Tax=Sphingomonas telluris TaxID=2907998 RepID=A0ABS9VLQ9_9SPHN|nr:UvrD-helicase domain-containing protein [Sphingomonas telluris]MCH8615900.1 UvrD-helicase domain-containing protein [Sphingomonas telluris]
MNLHLADTFTAALARLPAHEAKAVKSTVVDLHIDPSGNGLQMHRIDKSKDPNFWSVRVNRDLRLIVHKNADSVLVAYVGHHDPAYVWAERRRIEAHPRTGAMQIIEVRELVEETQQPSAFNFESLTEAPAAEELPVFAGLDEDQLMSVGVPADWVEDVRGATEDGFFKLAAHLPDEAAEALLEFAATGKLPAPAPAATINPYEHPDTLRRIRPIADQEELEQALSFPWDKWGVFLHPSQRSSVERDHGGSARVAGSAGTGKTIVALHRAVRLAKTNPRARILLTTFSDPLADALKKKLAVLSPETSGVVRRITVESFQRVAEQLFQLVHGARPRIAGEQLLRGLLKKAAEQHNVRGFSERFLLSEWTHVIDAWGIASAEAFRDVQRMGRKSRLGPNQRERLWPVFESVRSVITEQGLTTWATMFSELAETYSAKSEKPFDHILIDEAQDLGPAELRFFAAIAPVGENTLFFAGDLGQRIFQHPYSWKSLGVDVRGRSSTLKVCYRTSQQIRSAADRLLPEQLRDVDGVEDERRGTISVFEGPPPHVEVCGSANDEAAAVAQFIDASIEAGAAPDEIGIFVRTPQLVERAKAAVERASNGARPTISVMHLAKGLEFKSVVVMCCDEGVLPLDERVADAADEAELDDIYETERRLLYVACTRARDSLLVTGTKPGSEFLRDLMRERSPR